MELLFILIMAGLMLLGAEYLATGFGLLGIMGLLVLVTGLWGILGGSIIAACLIIVPVLVGMGLTWIIVKLAPSSRFVQKITTPKTAVRIKKAR